ncbi:MAG TPA: putative cobaltochelatase [Chloroflexota bacterium]|nr:putative cobaltochelatase [Chloroflexota bacterium]
MSREAPTSARRAVLDRRPVFPFSALVGQERMKRALLLNTINPRIGGVLIRGEKGTAKSTAVRALANLLPEIEVMPGCAFACDPAAPDTWCDGCRAAGASTVSTRRVPLVELPVGATEDRVVGTLDLERAIKQGERHFEPGLLAAANRGILYVDEVNLLNDHLVDVLLDAAAMGVNYVEREGVSVQHPAQFLLVGTMNPEEGDLRPQLLDRFALAVEVEGLGAPEDRAEVVRRRIAFEADPLAFAARWADAEAAERERILAARALLSDVRLDDRMLGLITQLCCDFEVDGLRADIVMYKTALTLAAYAGRRLVTEGDVRDAAELALLHRRRRQPFEQPGLDRDRLDERIQDYMQRTADEAEDEAGDAPTSSTSQDEGEGSDENPQPPDQVFAPSRTSVPPHLAAPAPRRSSAPRGRRSKAIVLPWQAPVTPVGPYVRSLVPREPRPRDWAFDATLRAAAPHQRGRRASRAAGTQTAVLLERQDLREKVRETRLTNLILFVVDASGSMAARDRMAAAKGAVVSLLLDAYRKRDQVGLIAFRGRSAELLLPPTSSVDLAEVRLRELPTGGRTPLAHGLDLARQTVERYLRGRPGTLPLLVVVSDGRANVPLAAEQRDCLTEVQTLGADLQRRQIAAVVIDSEAGPLQLGMAAEMAAALGARYLRLDDLDAERLAGAVREARA